MMGNEDYLSGGCNLPEKLLYEKLYKKKLKNTENYYMIMPENLHKYLAQKTYTECATHENYYSAFPPPLPPPKKKKNNQIWILSLNSLTRELKIRVYGLCIKSY